MVIIINYKYISPYEAEILFEMDKLPSAYLSTENKEYCGNLRTDDGFMHLVDQSSLSEVEIANSFPQSDMMGEIADAATNCFNNNYVLAMPIIDSEDQYADSRVQGSTIVKVSTDDPSEPYDTIFAKIKNTCSEIHDMLLGYYMCLCTHPSLDHIEVSGESLPATAV